jgi:hypothetical protein
MRSVRTFTIKSFETDEVAVTFVVAKAGINDDAARPALDDGSSIDLHSQ